MTDTTIRFVLVSALAMIFVMSVISPNVVAAGTTDVELSPGSDTITTGSTTTADIVVTNASGGVGAVNVTVSLTPGDAATITNISLDNSAYSVETQTNTDNTSVTVIGFGLDTNDSGSVVVGDLTVRGDTAETVDVSLQVNGLGDESGSDYSINSADGASISVTSGSEGGGGGGGSSPNPTTTATESPTTPTNRPTTTTASTTTTQLATTIETEATDSQASGFGPLTMVTALIGSVILVLARRSS